MSNDDNEIDLESVIGSIKKNFEDGFREGQGIIGGLGNDKKAEENTDSKASNEPVLILSMMNRTLRRV